MDLTVMDRSETIRKVCEALLSGENGKASSIAQDEYPFRKQTFAGRKYKEIESTRIFIRDKFLDRYSGQRLVFPAVLRLISRLLPNEFPAHPNWKMSECHIVYWELFPTVDHVVPVTRGGADNETNWVTTSMLRNSAKSNWTLEELNWKLLPSDDFEEWDGLTGWFLEYISIESVHLQDAYIQRWYNALLQARKDV